MTEAEIQRLRELCNAATAGPWERYLSDGCHGWRISPTWEKYAVLGDMMAGKDAVFVSAARTALPALLDAVTALKEENARLLEDNHRLSEAAEWVKTMLPEMECRGDEECDHCFGMQLVTELDAETGREK
jgi:hypothetical protein